jgi:hypothetical protein
MNPAEGPTAKPNQISLNRRISRPLSSTNYRPLIANMPDVNNLYSMDEQIFEDNNDDFDEEKDEVDTFDGMEGGKEESAINNFLENGSITAGGEDEYGNRRRKITANASKMG